MGYRQGPALPRATARQWVCLLRGPACSEASVCEPRGPQLDSWSSGFERLLEFLPDSRGGWDRPRLQAPPPPARPTWAEPPTGGVRDLCPVQRPRTQTRRLSWGGDTTGRASSRGLGLGLGARRGRRPLLAPALRSLHGRRGVKGCALHGGKEAGRGQGGEGGDPQRRGCRGWRGGRLACGPTWYLVPTPGS